MGIGFYSQAPLTVGEKGQLKLEVGPLRWASRMRVKTCQSRDGGLFEIGAEFIGNELVRPWGVAAA